ncbi:MAG: LamG-like jellyroll fold domain-containing protein [Nanoarchaeota archaeon]
MVKFWDINRKSDRVAIIIFILFFILIIFYYLVNFEENSGLIKDDYSGKIISIINAEHLDGDMNFMENIFNLVIKKDDKYVIIKDGESIKLEFEKSPSNLNDISFYARSEKGGNVYAYSDDENLLFNVYVKENKLYKNSLEKLKNSTSIFYLKVNGSIEFDYIYDPLSLKINISDVSSDTNTINITRENNFTHLVISNQSPYYNDSGGARPLPINGLVIYYPFDVNHTQETRNIAGIYGNRKGNFTYDFTRWDNDGDVFLNGTGKWNRTCGMYGGCYQFDGDGDFINVTKSTTNESLLLPTNLDLPWSFTMWFKTEVSSNATKRAQTLISFDNNKIIYISTYNNITTDADSNGLICGSGGDPFGGQNITVSKWHFISAIVNKSTLNISLYIDNRTGLNCGAIGSISTGGTLSLGTNSTYGEYFNGSIDEFMFFQNVSLTAAQVLDIYNNQSPRFNSSGIQEFGNQSILNISSGYTEVVVTGDVFNYSNSSINLSVAYYDGGWTSTAAQVFSGNNTFAISGSSTNLTLNFSFYAGNYSSVSSLGGHNFYSPILSSVTKNLIVHLNDSLPPDISITTPSINNSNSSDTGLDILYTRSDANLESCWYSNDTYLVNITLASCGNITTLTWSDGLHNVTIWANDTSDRQNKSTRSFKIDSIKPDVNITSPINKTESSDTGLDILYTRSDINLESCWYSNDSYSVNTTLASCGNLTTITWVVGPHNATIYVNDTAGNENRTSVTFNITSSDSGGSSGGGAASGSGGASVSASKSPSENNNNINEIIFKEVINKEIIVPKDFVCGEWGKCNVNYELNNLNENSLILGGEQSRICTNENGEVGEVVQRRDCDISLPKEEISITKVDKELKLSDINNKFVGTIDIIERFEDGVLIKELNLEFYL